MDTYGIGACIRLRHHPLVPNEYKRGGPWVRGKKGYGLAVRRRGKLILEFPPKLFWGKCPAGKTIRLNLINHLVGFIPCQICLYFSN